MLWPRVRAFKLSCCPGIVIFEILQTFDHKSFSRGGEFQLYLTPHFCPGVENFTAALTFRTLWKFQLSFIHFFNFFGLTELPTPQEIPIPSVGGERGVWIFSGTAHYALRYGHAEITITKCSLTSS